MNNNASVSTQHVCVFCNQGDHYALDARWVRSVVPAPELTPVPGCDDSLVGLAYLHKGFLPVFELSGLVSGTPDSWTNKLLLALQLEDGDVGLLVDRVIGLESPEISYTNGTDDGDGWQGVISGTANCLSGFVSVIDVPAFGRLLNRRMQSCWQTMRQLTHC